MAKRCAAGLPRCRDGMRLGRSPSAVSSLLARWPASPVAMAVHSQQQQHIVIALFERVNRVTGLLIDKNLIAAGGVHHGATVAQRVGTTQGAERVHHIADQVTHFGMGESSQAKASRGKSP